VGNKEGQPQRTYTEHGNRFRVTEMSEPIASSPTPEGQPVNVEQLLSYIKAQPKTFGRKANRPRRK